MSKEVKVKSYNYFDTPDGEDLVKKLWYVLKPTVLTGLYISTGDVMLHSRPKGYMATLGRYAYITFPLIGMSTAFVVVTNLCASIRKSDDKANWVAGACTAGGIFGAWRKSSVAGFTAAAAFSLVAVLKKHAVQHNWELIPANKPLAHGGLNFVRHDFTLLKDPRDESKQ